jgi:hypothetical protein
MSLRYVILLLPVFALGCRGKDKAPMDRAVPASAASAIGNVDARGIIFVGGTPQDIQQQQPRVKLGNMAPKPTPAPRPAQ